MSPLWDRERVDRAKARAWRLRADVVALDRGTSPADGLQAARELFGSDAVTLSGINASTGFPLYRLEDTR